jgi:S1-C subfamily serine protease
VAQFRTAPELLAVRHRWCVRLSFAVLAMILSGAEPASGQSSADIFAAIENSISDVVEKAEGSIVAIARIPIAPEPLERQAARDLFGRRMDLQMVGPLDSGYIPKNPGTGILMKSPDNPQQRLILTNYHVVQGGQPFRNDGIIRSESRIAVRFSRTLAAWANRHRRIFRFFSSRMTRESAKVSS